MLVVFGHIGGTLSQEFHAFQTFRPQFSWGRHTHKHSHSHIELQITRNHSKPHTRGPWSPWSPCRQRRRRRRKKQNLDLNMRLKHAAETLKYSGIIQNIQIESNNTGTHNYSLWLKVKSLMIRWNDMSWVLEEEKDREQRCEVCWVWWEGGGRTRFMPDFVPPEIFGFLPFLLFFFLEGKCLEWARVHSSEG